MTADEERERFRQVLSHFPTGVVVVTGMTADGPAGLAVGSFASVSLEPPLVGFFVALSSTSWPPIRPSGHFCVNLLASAQSDVCRTFARSGGDKFAGVSWTHSNGGSPVLDGVVAWVDCEVEQEIETGDHQLVIGRVLDLEVANGEAPLLFHRGSFPNFEVV